MSTELETGWSKAFPQVSGWYWMRGFRQYRMLPVEVNGSSFGMMYGNGVLFFARDAEGCEFLGPIIPVDTEQLVRLRESNAVLVRIAQDALQFRILMNGPCKHEEFMIKLCTQCEIRSALRHALGTQEGKSKR
jgi:hypothetical protein